MDTVIKTGKINPLLHIHVLIVVWPVKIHISAFLNGSTLVTSLSDINLKIIDTKVFDYIFNSYKNESLQVIRNIDCTCASVAFVCQTYILISKIMYKLQMFTIKCPALRIYKINMQYYENKWPKNFKYFTINLFVQK